MFIRGEDDLLEAFMAPYGETAAAVVSGALGEGDSKGVGESEGPVGLP